MKRFLMHPLPQSFPQPVPPVRSSNSDDGVDGDAGVDGGDFYNGKALISNFIPSTASISPSCRCVSTLTGDPSSRHPITPPAPSDSAHCFIESYFCSLYTLRVLLCRLALFVLNYAYEAFCIKM